MEAVSYSLRRTVFGILKTLVVRASQNNLDLTYDIVSDIPDQLIGDSLRLRQVSSTSLETRSTLRRAKYRGRDMWR